MGWLIGAGVLMAAILLALWAPPEGQAQRGEATLPASVADRVPSMTGPKAKFVLSRVLKREFRRKWIFGDNKRISNCKRLSRVRVSCKVSWTYDDRWWYHGRAAVYYRDNGGIWYKFNIDRDRI
jgi:hypothetical protein